ncbi:MAG TPA: AsmA family protein, partial [Cyclobacteriaceae bacterium]|nr:AsmA family protein [Cyclobacteriaceae bacterium]
MTIWIVFEKKNDWLLREIQLYANETQSGQLEIQSMELSLIRSFPGITVVLNDIYFYEHRDSLRAVDEKPIVQAEKFFIRLKLIPLLKEAVEISDVSLSNARLSLETDAHGKLNLMKALAPPVKVKSPVQKVVPKVPPKTSAPSQPKKQKPIVTQTHTPTVHVDLEHLELQNVQIKLHTFYARDSSVVEIRRLELDVRQEDSLMVANVSLDQNIKQLHVNQTTIKPGLFSLIADLKFDRVSNQLALESTAHLENFEAAIKGTYDHQKNQYLNLEIDGSANDLQLLSLVLSRETMKLNADLLKRGDVYLKGTIFGEINNQLPQFDISIGARDLSWRSIHKNLTFEDIGFDARFQSGIKLDFSEASLELKKLRGKLPGGSLKGDFNITNFVDPVIKYDLEAHARLDGYDEVFNLTRIKNLSGEVSLKAFFEGPLDLIATHQMDSSRSSSIILKNLSFQVLKTKQQVSQFSASLITRNNQTIINPFSLRYGDNQIQLTATVQNLLYFLVKRSGLTASGKMMAPQLLTKDFLFDSLAVAQVQDRISNLSLDFEISTKRDSASAVPTLAFSVQNLNAKFDELPDINRVNTAGVWRFPSEGLRLDLTSFHGNFPQGKVDVIGDLFIPNRNRWEFNADVKLDKFPWTYIRELSAEMRDHHEPTAKKIAVAEMDLLSGNFKTSASIIPYPFDFTSLSLTGSKIQYAFPKVKPISADNLEITLDQLLFKHPQHAGYLTGLQSTKGKMKVKKLDAPSLKMSELQASISGLDDLLTLDITGITRKSNQEQGKLSLDFSQKGLGYHLTYEVKNADVKYFIQEFTKEKMLEGYVNYKLDLTTNGLVWEEIKKNTYGKIEISSSNLRFYGLNIDKALRKYERSQNFNLTDIGAVVIAGPVGLAVTKGTEFVSLAAISTDSTQQTAIKNLYARWDLKHLMLTTEDVAFTTAENRIAFDGKIDFATNTVPGLTIAVVDKKGCSLMDQNL